jgi:hypothetical protein
VRGYPSSVPRSRKRLWTVAPAVLTAALTLAACTSDESSPTGETQAFSNPTEITNSYLPFAERGRWVYEGTAKDEPYLIEVAVTPATRTIEWGENSTETLVVRRRQWVNGLLIQEALVHYAQDDGGGVWSFGQDVDNFKEGELADHEGSRLAGADGVEPILVMPGEPQGGQAFSGEDVLGLDPLKRHEVVSLTERVDAPDGPVDTGLVVATVQPGGAKEEERVFVPEVGLVLARGADSELSLAQRLPQDAESAALETFSDSTNVNNAYFGVTGVDYRLYLGEDEGEPLRIEVAPTGETKSIDWEGGTTETVVSQFIATSERDLLEIAVDWFAQDDSGNVWYFGEDVFNYEEGRVANMGGSWLAGKDGPPGLIMPGDPALGQRFNPENIPGLVFETVEVQEVDGTFTLSTGEELTGVLMLHEVLDDGSEEFKEYATGYGNLTTDAPPVERVDIVYALPNDAIGGPVPGELGRMLTDLRAISTEGTGGIAKLREAFDGFTSGGDAVPEILVDLAGEQLDSLEEAMGSSDREEARMAALDLEHTVLDLARLYQTKRPVDLDLLDLHARRMLAAADAEDLVAASTAAALARGVAERNITTLSSEAGDAAAVADAAAEDEDLAGIAEAASALRAALFE